MAFNVAALLQNVSRLMAFSMPNRLALEVVNQELLYSTTSVISATSQEPNHPSEGDAYIIPFGGWGGEFPNFIAYFDGEEFLVAPPRTGQLIYIQDTDSFLNFNGSTWIVFGFPAYFNTITVAAAYPVGPTDYTIRVNAASAVVPITLPNCATSVKRVLNIKKIDSSVNLVNVQGNAAIDGLTPYSLAFQNQSITIQSNGVTWDVL